MSFLKIEESHEETIIRAIKLTCFWDSCVKLAKLVVEELRKNHLRLFGPSQEQRLTSSI